MPINPRQYFSEIEEASGPLDPSHPEFDARVRARMGPEFADLFNPAEKAQSMVVGDPTAEYTTLGINFRPDTPIERIREVLEPVTHETRTWSRDFPERKPQVIPKGKRIFGLGAGATPQTWAHEYRHNRLYPGNTLDDAETLNRVYDILYSSTSLPAYRNQIRKAHRAFFEWAPDLSFEDRMTLRQLPDADKEERVLHMVATRTDHRSSLDVPFLSALRSAFRGSEALPKNPNNVIRYNYELNKKGAVGGFLGKEQLPSDVIDYRARYPFLNFIGRLGNDVEKYAEGGEVQAEPTESPLEAARRIRDSLISSSQRFAEGGEVKKEESPMASPVGGAKQMLAELEAEDKKLAERKRPRSKESIEEERASKELDRGTLMSGSLVAPTIAREGELTVRRFAGGGSAQKMPAQSSTPALRLPATFQESLGPRNPFSAPLPNPFMQGFFGGSKSQYTGPAYPRDTQPEWLLQGYRHDRRRGQLETLPSRHDREKVRLMSAALGQALRDGVPGLNRHLNHEVIAAMLLKEGREDLGANHFNENDPKSVEIYGKYARLYGTVPGRAVAAAYDKAKVADRLRIPFASAWIGTGRSKFETSKEYAQDMERFREAVRNPKNAAMLEFIRQSMHPDVPASAPFKPEQERIPGFAGGGSVDKGKLTLEPVGGVEFGPASPAPRSLKDYVPGAADLPRSPPQKAPGWGDPAAYNPQGLAYAFGTGIRNTLEGLAALPGTAADMLKGIAQREFRERSPEGMRGSAPAMDTTTYDAAKSALKEAAGNPVEAARNIRDSLVSYVRQGVATPQSTAQFIGENVNPLRARGPVSRGPVLDAVRPSNYGVMLPEERDDGTRRPTVISEYRDKAMSRLRLKEDIGLDKEVVSQIRAFLQTKPTNYFSRQMGTPKDPVLKNILAGQYRTGPIKNVFPDEMLKPDRRADAVQAYDNQLGIQSWVLNPNPAPGEVADDIYGRLRAEGLAKKESIRQGIRDRIAAQGVPESEINFNHDAHFGMDPLYYSLEGRPFFDNRLVTEGGPVAGDLYNRYKFSKIDPYESESLDPSVVTAIEKQEPIYSFTPSFGIKTVFDPEAMVDYLATLPPNKIRNIRFEDALRGATNVVKKRDVVSTNLENIKSNKTISRSVFDEGTRLVEMDVNDADPSSPPYTGDNAVQWRQIVNPEVTQYEGAYLGHSVGGYSDSGDYSSEKKQGFREGKIQLYSLRDNRGMPVTTVEVQTFLPSDTPVLRHVVNIPDDKPVQLVTQIRGAGRASGNANPPRWAQRAVVDLLRGPLKGIQVADVRYKLPDSLQGGFPMGLLPPSPPSWMLEWGAYKKFKDEYDKLDPIQQYNYDQAYGKPDSMFPAPGDDAPQ